MFNDIARFFVKFAGRPSSRLGVLRRLKAEHRRIREERFSRPAWPGAPHSVRDELNWLRASGQRVGPGHPWFEQAHRVHQH